MLRWTETLQDEHHVATFPDFVCDFVGKPIRLVMKNKSQVDGTFYSSTSGNTHGQRPYYAGLTLETAMGPIEVDYLDVELAIVRAEAA